MDILKKVIIQFVKVRLNLYFQNVQLIVLNAIIKINAFNVI